MHGSRRSKFWHFDMSSLDFTHKQVSRVFKGGRQMPRSVGPAVCTLLLSQSTLLHHRPHCPSSQDFRHPTTLSQLAIFLRDAMARRHNTHKAMVLVGPPDNDDHCYVVALRAKESAGVMQVSGCRRGGGLGDALAFLHIGTGRAALSKGEGQRWRERRHFAHPVPRVGRLRDPKSHFISSTACVQP